MRIRHLWAILCIFSLLMQLLSFVPANASQQQIVMTSDTSVFIDALSEGLCSWSQGGTDPSSVDGDDYCLTPAVYIADGSYVMDKSAAGTDIQNALQDTVTDTGLDDLVITSDIRGTNGIVIYNSDYTVTNADVAMLASKEDGSTSCDFSGKGAALAVYGNSNVEVTGSTLKASGVANLGLFVDNGATVLLNSSSLSSSGGTLYGGYVNSPKQSTMVAPPWILGIMGNSRASNLMGENSTLTVVDSEISASNWAVLSTDAGSNMAMNVVNSHLMLTGSDVPMQADGAFDTPNPYTTRSGYGSYVIGNAREIFLGVTMDVGTYAAIFTGGSAYYGNLIKGKTYTLTKADGTVHIPYTAKEDVPTVIRSDTFGFMAHQGTNHIVLDGVQVNSGFSSFVIKSGTDTDITIQNGTQLHPDNGILLQLFDNDDATTGFDSETKAFAMTHEEYAGFPTEAVQDSSTAGKGGMDPFAGSGPNHENDKQDKPQNIPQDKPQDKPDGIDRSPSYKPEMSTPDIQAQEPSDTPPDIPPEMPPDGNAMSDTHIPPVMHPDGDAMSDTHRPPVMPPDGDAMSDTQKPPVMPPDADAMSDTHIPPDIPSDMPRNGNGMAKDGDPVPGGNAHGNPPLKPDKHRKSKTETDASSENTTTFTVSDTCVTGDIFNGIGWNANALSSGNVKNMILQVHLQSGAVLNGAIASTSCIHATYDGQLALKNAGITAFDTETEAARFASRYQATSFSQSEYFNICQVANLVRSNGLNMIHVSLTDNAVWNVTGTSLINSLTVDGDATVIVGEDVILTVNNKTYTSGTYSAADF